jgi:hypothetical protein
VPNLPDEPLGAAVVADAADLLARALRAHERVGAFASLAPATLAVVRQAARVLAACAAERRDALPHHPNARRVAAEMDGQTALPLPHAVNGRPRRRP